MLFESQGNDGKEIKGKEMNDMELNGVTGKEITLAKQNKDQRKGHWYSIVQYSIAQYNVIVAQ